LRVAFLIYRKISDSVDNESEQKEMDDQEPTPEEMSPVMADMARSDPLVQTSPKHSPIEVNKIEKEDDTGEELTDRSEADDWEMVESAADQEFKKEKFSPSEELVIPQSLPEPECALEVQDMYENEEIIIERTLMEDSRDTLFDGCTIQRHVVKTQHVKVSSDLDDNNSDDRGKFVGMEIDEEITEIAPQVSIPFDDRVDIVRATEESSEELSDGTWVSKRVTHVYVNPRNVPTGSDLNIVENADELGCVQTSEDVTNAEQVTWRNQWQQEQEFEQYESDAVQYGHGVNVGDADETSVEINDEHLMAGSDDVQMSATQENSYENCCASEQVVDEVRDVANGRAVDESFDNLITVDEFQEEPMAGIAKIKLAGESTEILKSIDNEIAATGNDDNVGSSEDDNTAEESANRQTDEFEELTFKQTEEVELSQDADSESLKHSVDAEETVYHWRSEQSTDDVEKLDVAKVSEFVDNSVTVDEPASELRSVDTEAERHFSSHGFFPDGNESVGLFTHETYEERVVSAEMDDEPEVVLKSLTSDEGGYLVTKAQILEEELDQQGMLRRCR
jgi:hypothetical protein